MNDNFDLKKFLKESKALENLNPSIKALNENESREERADVDKYEYEKGKKAGKREEMKAKIREIIAAELAEEVTTDNTDTDDAALNADYSPVYENEEDEDYSDYFFDIDTEEDLEEAKKKKKEDTEDVEDVNIEDTTIEDVPADDAELDTMGAEMGAEANLDGDEKDIMNNLMRALEIAKQGGNEKVITQISNTLKFFISEYVAN
jgi:hypothetical protein